ncbi:MAG: hypothetical protein CMB74_03800 [Euryarchaeota archaeon]|nr:hypothetical protein [Euryarchaeota archaeon]
MFFISWCSFRLCVPRAFVRVRLFSLYLRFDSVWLCHYRQTTLVMFMCLDDSMALLCRCCSRKALQDALFFFDFRRLVFCLVSGVFR